MAHRFLEFKERQIIEECLRNREPQVSIALKLKRSRSTISSEINRNHARGYYNAIDAQQRYDLLRYKNVSNAYPNPKKEIVDPLCERVKNLEQKLEILESHLEIIIDNLKGKND